MDTNRKYIISGECVEYVLDVLSRYTCTFEDYNNDDAIDARDMLQKEVDKNGK